VVDGDTANCLPEVVVEMMRVSLELLAWLLVQLLQSERTVATDAGGVSFDDCSWAVSKGFTVWSSAY